MDTNRTIQMVLADLSLENLKQQENLETAVNAPLDANKKLNLIKKSLKELILTESMIARFKVLVENPNNNKPNPPEDGKV